jgi:ribonuclease BN (tRNA processing enzyme)
MQNTAIILGSGSFCADTKNDVRNPAGYAVKTAGETIILDIGFGNVRGIARAGLDYSGISHVFLTHFHPDHWGDLPALLFAYHYNEKPKDGKLVIAGPAGTSELVGKILATAPAHLNPLGYKLAITELAPGAEIKGKTFRLVCAKAEHSPEALSFKIYTDGKTLGYTGDSVLSEELKTFCQDADVIIADAGGSENAPKKAHMTPAEAASLSDRADIYLSHLTKDSALQAAALAGPRIKTALDLLSIPL